MQPPSFYRGNWGRVQTESFRLLFPFSLSDSEKVSLGRKRKDPPNRTLFCLNAQQRVIFHLEMIKSTVACSHSAHMTLNPKQSFRMGPREKRKVNPVLIFWGFRRKKEAERSLEEEATRCSLISVGFAIISGMKRILVIESVWNIDHWRFSFEVITCLFIYLFNQIFQSLFFLLMTGTGFDFSWTSRVWKAPDQVFV